MPATRDEAGGRSAEGSTYHHRQAHHHFHHGAHRGGSLLQHVGGDHRGHSEEGVDEQPGTPAPALSELKAVISWLQKGLPFILILLAKLCFQHKLGESQWALSAREGLRMPRARARPCARDCACPEPGPACRRTMVVWVSPGFKFPA
jgi:hypothetical protein